MNGLRQIVPALGIATAIVAAAFSVSAVYAGGPSVAPSVASDDYGDLDGPGPGAAPGTPGGPGTPAAAGEPGWHHGPPGGGALGPAGHLLHQLNLTADQKAQIKAVLAGQKSRFEDLRRNAEANMHALATTPPTDPGYPALVQAAQGNAAARIALMSDVWKQIYESVLTKAQRDQIPSLVAAAEQARAARMGGARMQTPASN